MEAFLMLADFAEELGGKLYVQGGGFSRIMAAGQPVDLFLAGKVLVPWNEANQTHDLRLELLDPDGRAVLQGAPGSESSVLASGQLEVGRPPGLTPGTDLDLPLAFRFRNLVLAVGRYRWLLAIDGHPVARVDFEVLPAGTAGQPIQ